MWVALHIGSNGMNWNASSFNLVGQFFFYSWNIQSKFYSILFLIMKLSLVSNFRIINQNYEKKKKYFKNIEQIIIYEIIYFSPFNLRSVSQKPVSKKRRKRRIRNINHSSIRFMCQIISDLESKPEMIWVRTAVNRTEAEQNRIVIVLCCVVCVYEEKKKRIFKKYTSFIVWNLIN